VAARCSGRAAAKAASGLPSEQRFGFPPRHRLRKRAEFQRLYTRGARVSGRYLVLFFLPAADGAGRFGVTASKRIGGAVVRSRCKRRLRELYRLHRGESAVADFDIVANARKGCATAHWGDVERDFQRCLSRGVETKWPPRDGGPDTPPV
jgi:ribonuclease P protein component